MQFFISHPARWLRTRRFSEPTFPTLWSHKSLEKHSESGLSYLFVRLHLLSADSFSSLLFFLLLFSSLLFSSLTLPTSAFPSVHTVGSLTSKLPSTTTITLWIQERSEKVLKPEIIPYIFSQFFSEGTWMNSDGGCSSHKLTLEIKMLPPARSPTHFFDRSLRQALWRQALWRLRG